MTFIKALILGIVQGITEFIPVSSSAHLKLIKSFLNVPDSPSIVFFDLFCHLGTTLAALIFLRKEIYRIFFFQREKILLYAIAILPLFPMYFLLKPLREYFSGKEFTGIFLIITSGLLFLTAYKKNVKVSNSSLNTKIKDVLFIGLMQAIALIPGISRSGSTIFAGCYRNWKINNAIYFSFILAIPTVLGGSFLEALKLKSMIQKNMIDSSLGSYIVGFFASFIVAFFSMRYIFSVVDNKKMKPFAIYCLVFGIFSLIYFNFIV
ncbi:MAG: undecaprenyl-diphosphate phosphatase [Chlamydiae bacterium]|nr:undecaprenyl-diphosphate phosphatase [Chlamydiota bacterium]